MQVEVCFPHTKEIYIDACVTIDVDRDDTRQDIIDRAIMEIGSGQFIFSPHNGYLKEPRFIKEVLDEVGC